MRTLTRMSTLAPLSQHLRDTAAAHPGVVAQRELVDGTWQEWTYAEFAERATAPVSYTHLTLPTKRIV